MKTTLAWLWVTATALALTDLGHAADTSGPPPDNVVIVLDASGSMAERMPNSRQVKMTAAKAALQQVLRQLPPDLHVGLLVFSGKNIPQEWVYPLGPRNDARLQQAIELPQPGGGTPLGAYLKKGADRLLQAREAQFGYGSFRLLVVTDGEAQDQELVRRYTPDIVARGITVDVIGVAMNQRHTLATQVHSYRAANDAQALQRALSDVFAEVGRNNQDTALADAFAELAPLPPEVAMAAIQALATSGNQPIGQAPPIPAAPASATTPSSASPSPTPTPQATTPSPLSSPPAPSHHPQATLIRAVFGTVFGTLVCCAAPIVVLIVVLRKFSKRPPR